MCPSGATCLSTQIVVLSVVALQKSNQECGSSTNGIRCFSAKHAAIGRKAKTGWLGIRIMC